jgi:hypothetical protein
MSIAVPSNQSTSRTFNRDINSTASILRIALAQVLSGHNHRARPFHLTAAENIYQQASNSGKQYRTPKSAVLLQRAQNARSSIREPIGLTYFLNSRAI